MTTNDKLREALEQIYELALMKQNTLVLRMLYELIQSITATQTPASKPEPQCKCSMRTKLLGDVCSVCNPELAAEMRRPEPQANFAINPDAGVYVINETPRFPAEPQAQADPEVFIYAHELIENGGGIWIGCKDESVLRASHTEGETGDEVVALITLQSHREAMEAVYRDANEKAFSIAKKDAALDACLEALKEAETEFKNTVKYLKPDSRPEMWVMECLPLLNAAITQAKEAST